MTTKKGKVRSNTIEVTNKNKKLLLASFEGTQKEKERRFIEDVESCAGRRNQGIYRTMSEYVGGGNTLIWTEDRVKHLDKLKVSRPVNPYDADLRFQELVIRDGVNMYEDIKAGKPALKKPVKKKGISGRR